jgi:hypothetical protein
VDIAARIITLYPVEHCPAAVLPEHDESADLFGVTPREGQSEFAASPWRPVLTGVRSWDPEDYGAPHAGTAYRVLGATTAVARRAGDVTVLLLEVPGAQDGTYFGSLPGSVVFVLAVALFAVLIGVAVRVASRVAVPPRWRAPARAARWALVGLTSLGILGAAVGVPVPAGVAVAGVGAVLLILLVAAEFEYEKH